MTRPIARLLAVAAICIGVIGLTALPAAAHNSLSSSDPTDGQALAAAPTAVTLNFAKSAPLETLSAELVDGIGARTELSGFTHGATDAQVIVPLPTLAGGTTTVRWRLVSADGHQVTGRVAFTTPVLQTAPQIGTPTSTISSTVAPSTSSESFSSPYSTPSSARWFFRILSYVGILALVGVAFTSRFVWSSVAGEPDVRRLIAVALGVSLFATLTQLLFTASDVSGKAPWASLGRVGGALETDVGKALVLRLLLLAVIAAVIFLAPELDDLTRWTAVGALGVVALATWAYAGHAKSQRWPIIGVPLDIVHHAAAAAWLGALALVGIVGYRRTEIAEFAKMVNRFSRIAAPIVGAIVGTGVLQSVRLVGNPLQVLGERHGQLLVAKLVLVAVMLKIASMNRRRVSQRLRVAERTTHGTADMLRRAMSTEFAVGMLVLGITAGLVVSPPAVANSATTSTVGETSTSTSTTTTSIENTDTTAVTAPGAASVPVESTTTAVTAPPTPSTTVKLCTITTTLQQGSTGADVTCLQQALAAGGWYKGTVSGTFDVPTDIAVRAAQAARGLLIDGIVGPQTAQAIGIGA